MSAVIAKSDLGPCCGCGINIERGEWTTTSHRAGPAHVGCVPLQKLHEVGCEKRESWNKLEPKKGNFDEVRESSRQKKEPQSGFLFGDAENASIETAQEVLDVKRIQFDGATVLQIDTPRLAGQLARVFALMLDGKFRTLSQIAGVAGCLETSASARLRDLRKARFGSHTVVSRQVPGSPLLYEYRLIINERKEIDGRRNAA